MFSSASLPRVQQYAALLADAGVVRGLIGPREVPRLWERHLLNCAVAGELMPEGSTVCDLGSGAGLPGLVLALHRPDLRITLVEPLLRRTTFLEEAVAALGLDTVSVHRGRAESLHGRETYDVVTSRAVAPLERLLGWSMPLVAPGGAMVAMKGSSAAQELADSAEALARWGAGEATVHEAGVGLLDRTTMLVRVARGRSGQVGCADATGASSGSSQSLGKTRRRRS
ncbi:16S rRNA (guanine(527)-N(7))-methyltransferase RsmG [Nocardioides donggukensis]|uniref:16S rRNA (guanine(527)-N(7))-methyltransferase RsmG n=1 Tax=Nocardioides donggukensis TaxID=2774019 RepID=UPI00191E78C9|nr:16S rRNA (guanine(527)-N(7))-methyltransferase RsmG [Nocardioides donggukensis]